MININVTLLIQIANFLVFLFLMNLVLYRPIRRILAERRRFIDERQGRITQVDAEAAAAVQEFSQRLQEARKQGRQKILDAKQAAYEQEKSLLQSATDEAGRRLQEMRGQIQKDIAAARDQLRTQIQSFSLELAQKILGRSI